MTMTVKEFTDTLLKAVDPEMEIDILSTIEETEPGTFVLRDMKISFTSKNISVTYEEYRPVDLTKSTHIGEGQLTGESKIVSSGRL